MKNLLSFPPSFEAFYSEKKHQEIPVVDNYSTHFENLSPFFSIALPTYNRGAMLSKAIDSVLQQTFPNFELIICDNNSSDNTMEIVKKYNDPRIRYIKYQTLVSLYDNHHRVINFTRSKWLMFLHSDDYLYPDALKIYHDLILDEQILNVSVYYPAKDMHQGLNWNSEGVKKNTYLFDNISYLYRYYAATPTGAVFRFDDIKKFHEQETYFESSMDLLLKILKSEKKILIVNENIVNIGTQKERDTTYVTRSGKLVDYLYRLLYSSLDKNAVEVILKSINNWTSQEIVFLLKLITYNNNLELINFIEEKLSPRSDYQKIQDYQNILILKYFGYWGFQMLYLLKCQLNILKYQFKKNFILTKNKLEKLSQIMPNFIKRFYVKSKIILKLILNYKYDLDRFFKWSSVNYKLIDTQTKLKALITMDYHRIEKGLALKEPRVGFGSDVIGRLIKFIPEYQEKYGSDETILVTLNCLDAYYRFNLSKGIDNREFLQKIQIFKDNLDKTQANFLEGGIFNTTKTDILQRGKIDLTEFFNSRYSIRHFSGDEVDIALIEQAVKMAQKTPSVCNRQSCKVYVFSDSESKTKVLSYQNGNRGFGEQVSKVLIVTSNLEHFTSIGERNQGWIDGGMFSMSLVYALHSLGLGTCCLNWSVEYKRDQALKQAADIPDTELIMMMIAVGHLPETLKIAQSPRKPLDEVLIVK